MSSDVEKQVFELELNELLELLDVSLDQFKTWQSKLPALAEVAARGEQARYGLKEFYWCYQLKRYSRKMNSLDDELDLAQLSSSIDDLQLSSTLLGLRKRLFEARLKMRRSLKKLIASPASDAIANNQAKVVLQSEQTKEKLWIVSFLSVAESDNLLEPLSPLAGHSALAWSNFIVKHLALDSFEDFKWFFVDFDSKSYDQIVSKMSTSFIPSHPRPEFLAMQALRRAGALWRKAAAAQANLYFLPLENPLSQGEVCRIGLEAGKNVAAYGLSSDNSCNWNGELFISRCCDFLKQGYQTMFEEIPHLVDNKIEVTQKVARECVKHSQASLYYKNSLEWGPAKKACVFDKESYQKAIELRSKGWLSRSESKRVFEVTPRIALSCEQFRSSLGGSIDVSRRLFDEQTV